MAKQQSMHKTIRVSFRTILIVAVLIVGIGGIGGVLGSQFARPTLPPLSNNTDRQFVTTVQEVTVSPSTQSVSLTERLQRSVVLLVDERTTTPRAIGTGVVITNDGLVVAAVPASTPAVAAIDNSGKLLPLSTVGADELYGLTYFRLEQGVVPPFELASGNPKVAAQLLTLSLSSDSTSPVVAIRQLAEYRAPDPTAPDGIMRIGIISQGLPETYNGAPLIDDEGRLAALVTSPEDGLVLPVEAVRSSINRIAANQRETNVFEQWGIVPGYEFPFDPTAKQRQFAFVVTDVVPGSPAAVAGLKRGDIVTKIQTTDITWDTDVVSLLSSTEAVGLTVKRGQLSETVTLNPAPASSP